MLIFQKKSDGGPDSTVVGYWLIELKWLFSIVLLKFNNGSRENFHSHAFNAITWFIRGGVVEEKVNGSYKIYHPSIIPKFTPRSNCHRVRSFGTSWALSFRGPWKNTWQEYDPNTKEFITLTHGRKII